jgi:Zn-dependent protease
MTPTNQGSIRLFRLAGIALYLHWSWFLVAYYMISMRAGHYPSMTWNVLEYLALFGLVLLHEFGHSLACRQVGGRADRIVLWPLGGVAYVAPPQRPGPTLWSIAAGPLVNVVLVPVFYLLVKLMGAGGLAEGAPNAVRLAQTLWVINIALLAFNLLPIYPLDGGQILRSLLWFVIGRAWSLVVATVIGLIGVAGLLVLALWARSIWLGILAVFVLLNCWNGLRHALQLVRVTRMARRPDRSCPTCPVAASGAEMNETSAPRGHCGIRS